MTTVVNAVIRGLGKRYADGTEPIEIHVSTNRANGLPYCYGTRVSITLYVNGVPYHAGLRATIDNNYVWICPNTTAMDGTPNKLAHIIADAGFKKNELISLLVDGADIRIETVNSPRSRVII